MDCLGGTSGSTPPNGLNRLCIAVPRLLFGAASSSRAARRMSRASCSMERPFSAARMRSRRFSSSSRLRTVMLAKCPPPCFYMQDYTTIAMQSLFGGRSSEPVSVWSEATRSIGRHSCTTAVNVVKEEVFRHTKLTFNCPPDYWVN